MAPLVLLRPLGRSGLARPYQVMPGQARPCQTMLAAEIRFEVRSLFSSILPCTRYAGVGLMSSGNSGACYELRGSGCCATVTHFTWFSRNRAQSSGFRKRLCKYGGSTIIVMTTQILKSIEWVGSSKSDLKAFPKSVRGKIGFALMEDQTDEDPRRKD